MSRSGANYIVVAPSHIKYQTEADSLESCRAVHEAEEAIGRRPSWIHRKDRNPAVEHHSKCSRMDLFLQTVKGVSTGTDDIIPSEIPVPKAITVVANMISHTFTSPSFPYRLKYVDLSDTSFWQAAIVIFLQPFIWNCLGRLEYRTRLLSKIFIKPICGVFALALWIFVAGLYRDALFIVAMDSQQTNAELGSPQMQIIGGACLLMGAALVVSSFYQLGFKGTYLGDYFGFLLDEKVTAFPFNILSDPMYDGSTLLFLGKAILARSPSGILLSAWVYAVYRFACVFEGSFTKHIYSQKEAGKKKQ